MQVTLLKYSLLTLARSPRRLPVYYATGSGASSLFFFFYLFVFILVFVFLLSFSFSFIFLILITTNTSPFPSLLLLYPPPPYPLLLNITPSPPSTKSKSTKTCDIVTKKEYANHTIESQIQNQLAPITPHSLTRNPTCYLGARVIFSFDKQMFTLTPAAGPWQGQRESKAGVGEDEQRGRKVG